METLIRLYKDKTNNTWVLDGVRKGKQLHRFGWKWIPGPEGGAWITDNNNSASEIIKGLKLSKKPIPSNIKNVTKEYYEGMAVISSIAAIKTLKKEVKDEKEIAKLLLELSKEGGAWVYEVIPFSHTTLFKKYNNPSSIPLDSIDLTSGLSHYLKMKSRGVIAYNGKLIPFSPAKIIKDQQRGITRSEEVKKPVIVVDLDGTIIDYDKEYQGKDVFGKPFPDSAPAIKELKNMGFTVVLYTCRPKTEKMIKFLKENGLDVDGINTTKYNPPDTSEKPFGNFYVDDNALRFEKDKGWKSIIEQIKQIQKQKANSYFILSVSIPKVPVDDDIEKWKESIEEIETLNPALEKDSKEYIVEVLKRFKEKGGLEKSVNINKPPETIANNENVLIESSIKEPSIFTYTTYRLPTENEIKEIDSFKLPSEEIYKGFCYTIIGRGFFDAGKKATIIKAIDMLCNMFPDNVEYKKALSKIEKEPV